MGWFSSNDKKDSNSKDDKLDNVTIDKDGIVKLDLSKSSVRVKVAREADKFKSFSDKLVSS